MARVELPSKDDIPSNNERDKKKAADISKARKDIEIQARSSIKKKEKSFLEELGAEGKSFIVDSIVMPTVKDMIYNVFAGVFDIIKDSIEAKIFGIDDFGATRDYRSRSNRRRERRSRDPIPFNSIYDQDDRRRRDRRTRSRDVMDYEDLYFTDMFEAKRAKEDMQIIYEDRGRYLYVADFKKIMGYNEDELSSVDYEWGWYTISNAVIKPMRNGGFIIDMPRPRPLDLY